MNMFEEARAMSGMLRLCNLTQEALAEKMGVSQSYVANKLRLLGFSPNAEEMILSLGLCERHARAILRLSGEDARLEMIDLVARRRLTVRECEAMVEARRLDEPIVPRVGVSSLDTARRFRDTVAEGVALLNSLGISASTHTSYFGKKTYLTVCIEE